jgi:hypothetical protein
VDAATARRGAMHRDPGPPVHVAAMTVQRAVPSYSTAEGGDVAVVTA